MNTSEICHDEQRRHAVRAKPGLNGLDYLEVGEGKLTLTVYFLGKAPQALLRQEGEHIDAYKRRLRQSVKIEGGRRIRDIKVEDAEIHQATDPKTGKLDPERDDTLTVQVDRTGDFSTYTLRLAGVKGIDPRYDHVDFSFKAGCTADLDCQPQLICPPERLPEPEINYLAKDYASFRQLILDRLALIMPEWKERHVPDLGIALVELLAYAGDHLSYYQDAVATEAYLDTARQRISVRRHALLVDYTLHEGCNARAWVCVETDGPLTLDPDDTYFITGDDEVLPAGGSILTADDLRNVPAHEYEVFEPMTDQPIRLYAAHNEIHFYTWGDRECCLPRGTTRATLLDVKDEIVIQHEAEMPQSTEQTPQKQEPEKTIVPPPKPARILALQERDILIFEEVIGPKTGNPADADPAHRHAVRLTRVEASEDPLNGKPIVEIQWDEADALPFPLCLSAIGPAPECAYIENISIACGNVILVDHGKTIKPCEELGSVPTATSEADCDCERHPSDVRYIAGRFRPRLKETPLTYRQPLPADDPSKSTVSSAASWMRQDAPEALPQAYVTGILSLPDKDYRVIEWESLAGHAALADALYAAGFHADCYERGVPLSPRLLADYKEAEAGRAESANALKSDPNNQKLKEGYDQTVATCDERRRALVGDLSSRHFCWIPQIHLLGSGPDDRHFVVEIDNDGRAHLRFGDGELGMQPAAGAAFYAGYRVGNGMRGNVGAEAIARIVSRKMRHSGVTVRVRNPLPAQGGADPEPMAEAKLFAPRAFRKQLQRAITADDYARLAERNARVQRAAAALAWTGSWHEAEVAVDSRGGEEPPGLRDEIRGHLYPYRRIGHDLHVRIARHVPLDIAMTVCVRPGYLRGHVKAALLAVFSNRVLPDGRLGLFHPDNLTFGEGVYLSTLITTAQAVTGVDSVQVTRLQRLFEPPNHEIEQGVLPLGPLEVARLDNDPGFPEHGVLELEMGGGR